MQGHKNWVLCLAWSPDGEMVASGGMEGALWLWDPKTGKPLGCCKGAATASASLVNSYLFLRTAPSQTKALGHPCIGTVREACYCTEDAQTYRAHKMDHSHCMGARACRRVSTALCQRLKRHHCQGAIQPFSNRDAENVYKIMLTSQGSHGASSSNPV